MADQSKSFISWKTEAPAILILGLMAAASAYFRTVLPERVPTHWNAAGDIDGWSSRTFVVWFFPLVALGIYLLMLSVWKLDPKRERYVEFKKAYHAVKTLIVFFLAVMYITVAAIALGYPVSMSFVMPLLLGILFIGIGWYLPEARQNWMFGIRTPWTLSSETVWNKTHALGGKMFVIAGTISVLGSFFPGEVSFWIFFAAIIIAALVPIVYSFILFRREKRF